jgi:PAS domain S-box-containing protein
MRALTIRADNLHSGSIALQRGLRRSQLLLNAGIATTVLLLAGILALFFHRSVLRPIRVLHAATLRIARGDIGPVPVPASEGELTDLTIGFNAMTVQLVDSRRRILDEAAFHAGENRLRELADALPHLVWAAQADGRVDYYNRRWDPILAGRNLTGSSWLDHLNPADRPSVERRWAEALRTGRPFDCEFRLGFGGVWRWYLGRVAPLVGPAGHIVRWVGTASDTEDRKRFEDDLHQSRQRAEVLHQLGLDLAGELDSERAAERIVTAAMMLTAADACVFHLHLPEPGRSAWRTFGSGSFRDRFPGLMPALESIEGRQREPIRVDDLAITAEDERQWPHLGGQAAGSLLAVPVASRRGLTSGWVVCLHGSRMHFSTADEQVLMGVAALAAIVLDNAHLFAGERAAQRIATTRSIELSRSNAELEQFAYVASHDLREPLRMISNFLGILEQQYGSRLDERGNRFVAHAIGAAQRMQELIHDLLEYSRVGAEQAMPESTPARAAVDAALLNLSQAMADAKAEVAVGELPQLYFRTAQLVQVFQNLIGNAIKFRGDAPPRIAISATRRGGSWVISVSDNGIGIDPQHHQRIFAMFQRLHGRERYPGMGIGLSLCKKIVESHGGEIGVEPNAGGGSRFWFSVPDGAPTDAMPARGGRPGT